MPARSHRFDVELGILVAELVAAWSFLGERFTRYDGWLVPSDVWLFARGAQYVADGALPFVYESARLTALPLYVVVEAPFYALGRGLGLSETVSRPLLYPTMWPLLFVIAGLGIVLLFSSLGTVARTLGRPLGSLRVAAGAFVVVPAALYGHYEDVWMLAFALLAITAAVDGRARRAAILLSVAICFKQTAALLAPALFASGLLPRHPRRVLEVLLLPAVLTIPTLVFDWPHASSALLRTPNFTGGIARSAPWVATGASTVTAGPYRLALLAAVIVGALIVWNRPDPDLVLAVMGVASLARLTVEPVTHAYYLAPGLLLLAIAADRTPTRWMTLAGGAVCLLLYRWHPTSDRLWWPALVAALAATAAPAVVLMTERHGRQSDPILASSVGTG